MKTCNESNDVYTVTWAPVIITPYNQEVYFVYRLEIHEDEVLKVDRALEKLEKGTVKVIDFSQEFDFEKILSQTSNRVINTLTIH